MLFLLCLTVLIVVVASSEYSVKCDSVFCRILDASQKEISKLKLEVDAGNYIPQFGSKADQICLSAVEQFVQDASIENVDDKDAALLHDRKVTDLEKMLDAPLHVIYLKQLALLREKALKQFNQGISKPGSEFESLLRVDEYFRREAEESTRQQSDWSSSREIKDLKTCLSEIAAQSRKITEAKLEANRQNTVALQSIQSQNQQLQALMQQMQGGANPWKVSAVYRVPDTNFNIQGSYQQGRANVQISCVPDESSHLLGADGFVHGMTPGNVGISFNINI